MTPRLIMSRSTSRGTKTFESVLVGRGGLPSLNPGYYSVLLRFVVHTIIWPVNISPVAMAFVMYYFSSAPLALFRITRGVVHAHLHLVPDVCFLRVLYPFGCGAYRSVSEIIQFSSFQPRSQGFARQERELAQRPVIA